MSNNFNYKNSGVDIDAANKTKEDIKSILDSDNKRVLNKAGAFSSLYDIKFDNISDPVLVLKTEEPGSKQLLAFKYDRIESVCFDMINHLINDCIVMGARPLAVQDAVICGRLEKEKVNRIVRAISEACREQECILTGGETSEQPGVLNEGVYILTSSIVGIADKNKIIDGSKISENDIVISLESSGLHTNGYSLVRKIIENKPEIMNEKIEGKNFLDVILEQHRCYYQALKDLFDSGVIKGMAHITGGGIRENLNRILPEDLSAEIDLSSYKLLPVFRFLKAYAGLDDDDMIRTFNMGVGIALVTEKKHKEKIIGHMEKFKINCCEIGKIIKGNKEVILKNKIRW